MIFYVFLDGIGMGKYDLETNPFSKFAQGIFSPLGGKPLKDANLPTLAGNLHVLPTDAHLGVPGLPQSATGQTAIWTGINGAKLLGRHVSGFPTITLRKIIQKYSMLKVLAENHIAADFLNCFTAPYLQHVVEKPKLVSASTLVQLASLRPLKNMDDLRNGRGLYMDLTHDILRQVAKDFLPIDDPLLAPRDPRDLGSSIFKMFEDYEVTIYEYFLTDKVGHAMDWDKAKLIIDNLEEFFYGILSTMDTEKDTLIVTSDHGNMEDLSQKNHTENVVPTFLYGKYADIFRDKIHSLSDIVPQIYNTFGLEEARNNIINNEFLNSEV
ncbi:metalloenzyme [Leptospira ognonensis]|uniref:Metalloenzyme n=1 Tax=Leptospira ognonensis TaxID=2484945 RepID=A0A4R9JZC9_9LEPT|nr:metalloenzyme [Leptospira ognonensis]TGL58039.1 metalloenzyme [Leptospira ognonensis]